MTMPQQQDSGADTTRIGVDFGVSTTVIAVAVPGSGTTTFAIPGISHQYPGDPSVHAIPSLVQYAGGKLAGCGEEAAGTGPDPGTVRWMRRYLCEGSPVQIPRGDGRTVGYEEATASFLTCILARVLAAHPGAALVFAVPAGAPPSYGELLQRAARTAGARSCSLVPEYRAALPGNGCQPAAGSRSSSFPFRRPSRRQSSLPEKGRGQDKLPGGCGYSPLPPVLPAAMQSTAGSRTT